MNRPNVKAQRLGAAFLLGCLVFNYPFMALFNRHELVFGVPLLYAYVFVVWPLLIALVAVVIERK